MPVHTPSFHYAAFDYNQSSANLWTTKSVHKSLPDITRATFEDGLSILGEYGWDLVSTVPINNRGNVLVFKRPGEKPARSLPSRSEEAFMIFDNEQAECQ
jgi:hypothetical protein